MTKRSMFLIAAFGLLASLGGVGSAHAGMATITQSFTIPTGTVPFNQTVSANQFNYYVPVGKGTLDSVEVILTATITGNVSIVNITAMPQAFTNATASVPVTIAGPDVSLSETATTTPQSGTVPPYAGTPYTLPGSTTTDTTSGFAANLTPYLGTGTNDLNFTFSGGTGTYGGSSVFGVFFGGTATAGATIQVLYNYTPVVPEPSSMALLGIGMAGFLSFRRLLQKRKTVA